MFGTKKIDALAEDGRRAARDVSRAVTTAAESGRHAAESASSAVTLLAVLAVCTLAVACLTLVVVLVSGVDD